MRPIQYPHTQAQPLPGILPEISVRAFRGANTFDPFSIEDGFFTDMANLSSDDFPALSVRPGYTVLGGPIGGKVLGIGVWKDQELHAVFGDGTWRRWSGSAWTTLTSGLNTSADWTFTNFDGNLGGINLIGSNGIDPIKRYDGTTVANLSGAPSGGNFITTYQNRLWCAKGVEVMASKLDDPTSWSSFPGTESDSYVKTMESTRGENVNMLSGSLTKLTIGMPGSLHELYGGLPSDFNTRLITELQGLVNNKSAITVDGVMRFIHSTGLYEYGGATLPDRTFSDVVAGYLKSINSQSVAGSDGKKLYFRIGDKILVYDIRAGVRVWSVWKDIQVNHFAVFKNELYIGDSTGRILKLGGPDDAGTPINWYAVTKPFTNASMAQRQRWYKMWVAVELAAGSTFNVHLSKSASGDSDWELVQSVNGTGITIPRLFVPVGKYALENYVRIKFSGTGWARLHEYTRQYREMPIGG